MGMNVRKLFFAEAATATTTATATATATTATTASRLGRSARTLASVQRRLAF